MPGVLYNQTSDMHHGSYRKFYLPFLLTLLAGMAFFLPGCEEEAISDPPQIAFFSQEGFLDHDTILSIGDRVKVGVKAGGEGDNITFFQVSVNNGTRQILLDSGLNNPGMEYNLEIIKSASAYERWTFLVMDRDRNRDSVQLYLGKSEVSNYGDIITYENLVLGAQSYAVQGSFLSLADGAVYNLEQAFQVQSLIDIIYYFDLYDATLSSPNEADAPAVFSGEYGLANWTIKNETRYDTTLVTPEAFNEAVNDSLLLAAYEPAAGKRKAKFVQPGMVISFVSPQGKIGLVNVHELEPGPAGYIRMSVKIQE
jgi:hypothetical protein